MFNLPKIAYNDCANCTIRKGRGMKEIREILFGLMTEGTAIEKAAKVMEKEILHNPVMVTNAYFHVIALASNTDFCDPVWEYAKKNHCCSKESIEAFRNDAASSRLFKEGQPFIYNENIAKDIPRILGKIDHKGITTGYMIVFEVEHSLSQEDIEKVKLCCACLGVLNAQSVYKEISYRSRAEYLYLRILDMNEGNQREVINEIFQFNWEFHSFFQVYSIKEKQPERKKYYEYISMQVQNFSNQISPIEKEGQMYLICNYEKAEEMEKIHAFLLDLCTQYGYSAGISAAFSELSMLGVYARQAKISRLLGSRLHLEKTVHFYTDYIFYDLLGQSDVRVLEAMISPAYKALKNYDTKSGGSLIETAHVLYQNGLNIMESAKVLHIHRNTLLYRIHQIEELSQIEKINIPFLEQIISCIKIEKWLSAKES
jgi:hypothetical protein